MTAQQIVELALKLAAHVNLAGAIDVNKESRYYGIAPAYLTVLQNEVCSKSNLVTPEPVTDLSQELALDDQTAIRLLPAGLVMYFALLDRDIELYNHYSELYYGSLVPGLKLDEVMLGDCYGLRGDPTMR